MSLSPRDNELREAQGDPPLVPSAADVELDRLPRCANCGYVVYGLPHLQCPECGAKISPYDLLPATDSRAEADRSARIDRRNVVIGLVLFGVGAVPTVWVQWQIFPVGICLASPFAFLTLALPVYRLALGEELRPIVFPLGAMWLLGGILHAVMLI